jgi:hypothetical protein
VPIDESNDPFGPIERRLETSEADSNQAQQKIKEADRQDAAARYTIAKIVVCTYAGVIAAVFLVLLSDALRNNRYDAFYTNAFEFMKTAVIPVVTYVPGYYSARSSR